MTTKTITTASRYLDKSRESNARERRGTIMGDLSPSTAREKILAGFAYQCLFTSTRSLLLIISYSMHKALIMSDLH